MPYVSLGTITVMMILNLEQVGLLITLWKNCTGQKLSKIYLLIVSQEKIMKR